jgi:hypothetical protein
MNGHFERHGDLVSLLRTENGTKARYMKKSSRIHEMSSPVLAMTERLLSRGVAEGKLAADIDPLRLYVMIAALSQFHLTNVHTLSSMFARDLSNPEWRAMRRADARRMLAGYLVNRTAGWRRVSGAPLDRAPEENQNAGTDETGDEIANPSSKGDAKKAQQEISYRGSDDAEHDVHEYAGTALHEHLGKPAGKAANDDRPNPPDFCAHGFLPLIPQP